MHATAVQDTRNCLIKKATKIFVDLHRIKPNLWPGIPVNWKLMVRINVHTTLYASLILRKPTKNWQTRSLILKTNSKSLQIQQKKENISARLQVQPTCLKTRTYLPLTGSDWLICSLRGQSLGTPWSCCEGILGCRGKVPMQSALPPWRKTVPELNIDMWMSCASCKERLVSL